jgi:hypothetical protein
LRLCVSSLFLLFLLLTRRRRPRHSALPLDSTFGFRYSSLPAQQPPKQDGTCSAGRCHASRRGPPFSGAIVARRGAPGQGRP